MVQISKHPLDKDIEQEIFKLFWESIYQMRNPKEVSEFFSDILSSTETTMLVKRFAIAVLIARGHTYQEIRNTIHVSPSTIQSVASWLKNAKPKMQTTITKISSQKSWEAVSDRIEEVIDKLPEISRGNWQQRGKEKWERTKKRATRSSLR